MSLGVSDHNGDSAHRVRHTLSDRVNTVGLHDGVEQSGDVGPIIFGSAHPFWCEKAHPPP